MPAALYNPQLNPMQSFMQQTGKTQADYQDSYNRGYDWTGDMSTGGWKPRAGQAQVSPGDPGALGGGSATPYGMGPGGAPGGSASSSSSSSIGGTMFGGKNPFATDAAAAKLRDEFSRMRKRTQGAINEDQSARGIFSSGVGANLMNEANTQLDLQEGAGLEALFNNAAQQQMAFDLEQQRMKNQQMASMYQGGSQRFDSGNTGGDQNQQLMQLFQQMQQGQGGGQGQGGQQGGGGQMQQPSGGVQKVDQMSPQAESQRRRDASSDFYKDHGRWPNPSELQMYLDGVSVA